MKNGIIAFCGSKGSGKSTSATVFKGLFQGETEELAFAGHLKDVCSKVFGLDMDLFINPAKKEVELENYVNLTKKNIEEVFKLFQIEGYQYDKHARQHVGQVFETPRKLLQYVGTELLHPVDPLIHVNITLKLKDPDKLSIITDLRFPQEFEALKTRPDFVPVYVYNAAAENKAAADGHASEKSVLLFKDRCLIVDNNGTMRDLDSEISRLIASEYGQLA